MQLHQKLLALSLLASVLLPLILVPVPGSAQIQPAAQSASEWQAENQNCTDCGALTQRP